MNRRVVSSILFALALSLAIGAVWWYDIPPRGMFHLSDNTFYLMLLGATVLFFAQWKVSNDVWLAIRKWFADHIWSIGFALAVMLLVHSFLFFRLYDRSYKRFYLLHQDITSLDAEIGGIASEIDEIQRELEEVKDNIKSVESDIYFLKPKGSRLQGLGW